MKWVAISATNKNSTFGVRELMPTHNQTPKVARGAYFEHKVNRAGARPRGLR